MVIARLPFPKRTSAIKSRSYNLFKGVIVSMFVATTAQSLTDHYITPAILLALLLGVAVSIFGQESKTVIGINVRAKILLRWGLALLSVKISVELIRGLGVDLIGLVIAGVVITILLNLIASRFFCHYWKFAWLTASSVAVFRVSAAMALSAILSKEARSEQRLIFTIIGVTVLSALAMVVFPNFVKTLAISETDSWMIIGGTIHDVAQVVGPSFSISEPIGDAAILVKLTRAAMLAPVILIALLLIRSLTKTPKSGKQLSLLPGFVVAFITLPTLNWVNPLPVVIVKFFSQASDWLFLTAIAAVGMKNNLKTVLCVGRPAISPICDETIFLAGFIFIAVTALP